MDSRFHIVTGAYGYSGKYIARRLLDRGRRAYPGIGCGRALGAGRAAPGARPK